MLNGRVYGSRSMEGGSTTYTEPEFVEWGYGGMGSNSNSSTARSTDYSKLQSGNKVTVGAAARSSVRDDDDDGSGMTWLKKRREMRAEKERLEKEAREAAAALAGDEAAVIVESPSSSSSSSSSNEEPISHTQGASTPTAASSLTPHTSRPASPSRPEVPRTQSAIDRHRCSAVNIPAPVSHHSHHHHHHPHHVPTIAEGEADAMVVPPIKKRADSVSSASSEADASSSNNEREDDDEEGDSESDDEDQEEVSFVLIHVCPLSCAKYSSFCRLRRGGSKRSVLEWRKSAGTIEVSNYCSCQKPPSLVIIIHRKQTLCV